MRIHMRLHMHLHSRRHSAAIRPLRLSLSPPRASIGGRRHARIDFIYVLQQHLGHTCIAAPYQPRPYRSCAPISRVLSSRVAERRERIRHTRQTGRCLSARRRTHWPSAFGESAAPPPGRPHLAPADAEWLQMARARRLRPPAEVGRDACAAPRLTLQGSATLSGGCASPRVAGTAGPGGFGRLRQGLAGDPRRTLPCCAILALEQLSCGR